MAITRSATRRNWSEMPYDILLHIFAMLNMLDRITNVAAVCKSWRSAASDEKFSKTLDIAECRQYLKPKTSEKRTKLELELVFVRGVNLGGLQLTTLVFDPPFQVGNRHLRYASRRCPNLQKLVLPFPNSTTNTWVDRALHLLRNLESFHIPHHGFLPRVSFFIMVGFNCPRLRVLKISCWVFAERHIEAITQFMPRLKVLSVRCVLVETDFVQAFSSAANLEEVYLSIINLRCPGVIPNLKDLPSAINDARNQKGLPSLQVFHVCRWEECNFCMAATMGGPPLNIPDLLPWGAGSAYIPN